MAYNKRTWINDETELSAENFNYIEEGIHNNQNIEIIAISEDEPEEYEIGDKYYNSIHKLIYTRNENDWGVGEQPIRGAFYLVLSEQSSYYFDGSDLVSVGGGSEDILIQDEEPLTDDWKLWIDTGEIDGSFSEVVDTLQGNETTKAPSVRAVNKINTYSTNEIIIGEYFGKPLYRKCYQINMGTETRNSLDISSLNIEKLFLNTAMSNCIHSGSTTVQIGYYGSSTDWSRYYSYSNKLFVEFGSTYSTLNKVLYLTIEYTKN